MLHQSFCYRLLPLPALINTRALKRAICCSVSFRAHIPWAKSNTAVIKSLHAARKDSTDYWQVTMIMLLELSEIKSSPKDLKTSVPANFPSKNTVQFSVLKKRLILTRTTSIEPEGKKGTTRQRWIRREISVVSEAHVLSSRGKSPVFKRAIWSFWLSIRKPGMCFANSTTYCTASVSRMAQCCHISSTDCETEKNSLILFCKIKGKRSHTAHTDLSSLSWHSQ